MPQKPELLKIAPSITAQHHNKLMEILAEKRWNQRDQIETWIDHEHLKLFGQQGHTPETTSGQR